MELERFKVAQQLDYYVALSEIKAGRKQSHWMWYVFPQLRGLGASEMAWIYGIDGLDEARAYLADSVLGVRLKEISEALLELESNDAEAVMGWPDNLKLCSCMTLFEQADPSIPVFKQVIEKFYGGVRDSKTLELLNIR